MNVDSHQHFWRYDPARHGWIDASMGLLKRDFLPEDLASELDANGIDASIAVQADQSEEETLFLLDLAERGRRIAGVVGWIDLASPRIEERLRCFSRYRKLCGFRHVVQSELDDRFMLRPEFMRGISCLREFAFTYDMLIYPKQLPAAIELAGRFPGQRFVVDHLAKPEIKTKSISEWAARMGNIAGNPNVYCKLSGLVTEADWRGWTAADFDAYLDVVFEAFGVDRLMFGSDWPVCLLAGSYEQVREIVEGYVDRHAPTAKGKIFGENASRLYDLKAHTNGFAD